jgi:DNA helicase-2/ATP-dependent DNA helicase PcrA
VFGQATYGLRSRFIDEIPAELTDREADMRLSVGVGAIGTGAGAGSGAGVGLGGGGHAQADWESNGARGARGARKGPAGDWAEASGSAHESTASAVRYRMGEDVVHAAFGEGVVTSVEPDGVIVVRFARDGSERKLMAEYAPVSRR